MPSRAFQALPGDHRFWSGLLALTAIPPVVAQVGATDTWHRIASWLLG